MNELVFVDSREGSKDLISYFPNGVLVELEYGDVAFEGNGPDGRVQIGVERKGIHDLVNSMMSGRLSGHQIPGLLKDYWQVYLMVEGIWRGNPNTGIAEVLAGNKRWRTISRGQRKIMAKDIAGYLTTLEIMTGIRVRATKSPRDTALVIRWLHGWWEKEWESHKGHLTIYKKPLPAARLRPGKISLLRRMAAELPHIGWGRSVDVEKYFGSVKRMVNSTEEEWREIEGIGKVTAEAVMEELR